MTCRFRIGLGEVTWYDEDGEVTMHVDSNNKVTTYKNKQEPVAYRYKMPVEDGHWVWNYCTYPDNKDDPRCEPLYTHPQPKREWAGLTEQDETGILLSSNTEYSAMKFTEAKLMEKNK
jgi:hypothetical protein